MVNLICESCKYQIDREIGRHKGKTDPLNLMDFPCCNYPNHCFVTDICKYILSQYQPERLNSKDVNNFDHPLSLGKCVEPLKYEHASKDINDS